MIKMGLCISLLVASVLSLSACGKTKVVEITDLASSSDVTQSSETTDKTETKDSLSDKVNNLKDKDTDTVGDFSKDFEKREAEVKKDKFVVIEDKDREAELKNLMRDVISKSYTSIKYFTDARYDVTLGEPAKATRTVKDENGRDKTEEYLTGGMKYKTYSGFNGVDITRNGKYYHSLYDIADTEYGYTGTDFKETYLIDNGDKTISYSKKYNDIKDDKEMIPFKAYIVDRDLENESVNFNYFNVLDNNEKYEIVDYESNKGSYYVYRTYIGFDKALEVSNLSKDMFSSLDTTTYKPIISLYFTKDTMELKEIYIDIKIALDSIKKKYDLGDELMIGNFNTTVHIESTSSDLKVEIPDYILKNLPKDMTADLEKENTQDNATNVDDSTVMNGDFTVYGKENK